MVVLHHVRGVGKEEVGIGLQVDDATIDEELAIALHEIGGRETLAGILHLRVAEGEPDLLYLVFCEETVDDLDVRTEEGDVLQSFVEGLSGPRPHAGSFDIHPDEVHLGIELGKFHRVFSLAAPEFEHDGILILEILFVPLALHIKRNMFHYRKGVLEHVLVCFHVGEFRQFAFAQSLTFLLFTFTQSQPLSSRACPRSHRTGCHEGCRRASWTVDLACRRMSSACLCRDRRYMRLD